MTNVSLPMFDSTFDAITVYRSIYEDRLNSITEPATAPNINGRTGITLFHAMSSFQKWDITKVIIKHPANNHKRGETMKY